MGHIWIMPDGDDVGTRCAKTLLSRVTPLRFTRWVKLAETCRANRRITDPLPLPHQSPLRVVLFYRATSKVSLAKVEISSEL